VKVHNTFKAIFIVMICINSVTRLPCVRFYTLLLFSDNFNVNRVTVLVIIYVTSRDKYRTDTKVVRTAYYSSTLTRTEESSNPYHIYSLSDLLQKGLLRGNLKTMGYMHA
jgi:predicted ATPase